MAHSCTTAFWEPSAPVGRRRHRKVWRSPKSHMMGAAALMGSSPPVDSGTVRRTAHLTPDPPRPLDSMAFLAADIRLLPDYSWCLAQATNPREHDGRR